MKKYFLFTMLMVLNYSYSQLYFKSDNSQVCRYNDFFLLIKDCDYEKLAEKVYENESLGLFFKNEKNHKILTINMSYEYFLTEYSMQPSTNIDEVYGKIISDLTGYKIENIKSNSIYKLFTYKDDQVYNFIMLRKVDKYYAYVNGTSTLKTDEEMKKFIETIIWRD